MKRVAPLITLVVVIAILAALGPIAIRPSLAQKLPYEVWVIDQADVDKGGAKLYIYRGEQLEGSQLAGTPEVIDLPAAAAGIGDGPGVRPHLLSFNQDHTHALIANVTSGHVYIMRAADRAVVASIDVGEQAHGAIASPDGSMVLVANQNGKKLARIWSDFATDTFIYNTDEDLDLEALEDDGHPDNAPICPMLFVGGGNKAYITLRGGGLYVVDAGSTPMQVLKSFDKSEVTPAGCGGVAVGNKVYINSGLATSSDLYVFDGETDELLNHLPFSDIGQDAHGMVVVGNYLWMGNRASANVVIVDTTTDAHVETLNQVGKAPDVMDISPNGDFVFFPLRGPNNLTGGPPAKGETPGFVAFRVANGGATGTRSLFVPIGSQSSDSPNDPHTLAVRYGVSGRPATTTLPGQAVPVPAGQTAAPAASAGLAPGNAEAGRVLYEERCARCHGARGEGETGDRLAGTRLSLAEVLQQVRQPRAMMPSFRPERLSDENVADIYAFLLTLEAD